MYYHSFIKILKKNYIDVLYKRPTFNKYYVVNR